MSPTTRFCTNVGAPGPAFGTRESTNSKERIHVVTGLAPQCSMITDRARYFDFGGPAPSTVLLRTTPEYGSVSGRTRIAVVKRNGYLPGPE